MQPCIPEKGRLNGLRMLVPRRRARAAAQTGRSLGHALRIKQMPLVVLRGEPIYKLTGEHSWLSPNGSVFIYPSRPNKFDPDPHWAITHGARMARMSLATSMPEEPIVEYARAELAKRTDKKGNPLPPLLPEDVQLSVPLRPAQVEMSPSSHEQSPIVQNAAARAAASLKNSTDHDIASLNSTVERLLISVQDADKLCATSHPANHITSRKSRYPQTTSRLLRREKENAELREQIAAKDKQIADKDKKIADKDKKIEFMLQTINVLTAR